MMMTLISIGLALSRKRVYLYGDRGQAQGTGRRALDAFVAICRGHSEWRASIDQATKRNAEASQMSPLGRNDAEECQRRAVLRLGRPNIDSDFQQGRPGTQFIARICDDFVNGSLMQLRTDAWHD
jgi:hypothetical protein